MLPSEIFMGKTTLDKLKIANWNATSVVNKKEELEDFLLSNNIDVALISETWLKPDLKFKLKKFHCYRSDRITHGGGVAIIIKKGIPHEPAKPETSLNLEIIVYKIKTSPPFYIGAAYNPPQSHEHLAEELTVFLRQYPNIVIGGDFNAKHSFWNCSTNNSSGNILRDLSLEKNFIIVYPPEHISSRATMPTIHDRHLPPPRCRRIHHTSGPGRPLFKSLPGGDDPLSQLRLARKRHPYHRLEKI